MICRATVLSAYAKASENSNPWQEASNPLSGWHTHGRCSQDNITLSYTRKSYQSSSADCRSVQDIHPSVAKLEIGSMLY